MKRTHSFMMISLVLMALMLSSCFLPDNYDAVIRVHKDGSYEFRYEGDLNFAPAVEEVAKGEFDQKDMEDMLNIAKDLRDEPGFIDVNYVEGGRFSVSVAVNKAAGEDYDFLSDDVKIFSFRHEENGDLKITGLQLEDDDLASLKAMGMTMNGELMIMTDKGVKVRSHNAELKVKEKKSGTVYIWELDIDSKKPVMVVKR